MPELPASDLDPRARLRGEALALVPKLRAGADAALLGTARAKLDALKDQREFRLLGQLAEEVRRHEPKDAKLRRLHAQSLIETGRVTAAVDVLTTLARQVRRDDAEWAEARGLLGRAHKQIFFDAEDKTSPAALNALRQAIEHYRAPFEADPARNSWHGVNLVALLRKARAVGARFGRDLDPEAIARGIIEDMARVPAERRDNWYYATAAEAELALDRWQDAEQHIGAYVQDERTTAFNLGSTLRQFTEVWDLEDSERGRGIVNALRARILALGGERPQRPDEPGGVVHLKPEQLQRAVSEPAPSGPQLEAILGPDGPKTYKWWRMGLERARSVASFRLELLGRFGTGFLVRGGDLVPALGDEVMVLTNWHVVNPQGAGNAMPPESVEVLFEAEDSERAYPIQEVVWSSPFDRHDASLLRLGEPPPDVLIERCFQAAQRMRERSLPAAQYPFPRRIVGPLVRIGGRETIPGLVGVRRHGIRVHEGLDHRIEVLAVPRGRRPRATIVEPEDDVRLLAREHHARARLQRQRDHTSAGALAQCFSDGRHEQPPGRIAAARRQSAVADLFLIVIIGAERRAADATIEPAVHDHPVPVRKGAGPDGRVPGAGDRIQVRVGAATEPRAPGQQPVDPLGEQGPVVLQVLGAHLIDDDHDEELRPVGRGLGGRGRGGAPPDVGGEQQARRETETGSTECHRLRIGK
jgi:hypothetical protein